MSGKKRPTLATKIERLFKTMHPASRGPYTLQEVSDGIRERYGVSISVNQLWELRHGKKANPRKEQLEALALFFRVPVTYFFDDHPASDEIDAELELLGAMRDAGVKNIALHATELTPEGRRMIAAMIAEMRQLRAEELIQSPGEDGNDTERRTEPSERPPRRGNDDA